MEDSYYKLLNDVLLGYKRNTPAKITTLRNNQIFVFGTDTNGSQKHGAAGLAAKCFGAKVGAVDVDSPDFSDLNDFTRGELGLTISSIEQMSITMLPMMSCEMDLAIGSDFTYIVPAHFPKLYSVLDVLESRLEWGHYNYDRIYVVFEDGVKLEVVYTEIPVDDKKPELKDYYKVAVRKVMR